MSFETKDSGERQQFDSGMQRDTQNGKTLFHLVYDGPMFKRWAELLTRGAIKYSERNWMKANGDAERDRFKASAARHFYQWFIDDTDEDHGAAVIFNINGAEYVKGKMIGAMPPEVYAEKRVEALVDNDEPSVFTSRFPGEPVDLMEKGETFTDDDIVDALYEVQEGAGTPDPHARETAERFNGGRPYYDETYTSGVDVAKEGGDHSFVTYHVPIYFHETVDGPLASFDEQPGQYIALMQQRRVEMAQALADHLEQQVWDNPDFGTSCSVDAPLDFIQKAILKVAAFYEKLRTGLARKLLDLATSLDPYVTGNYK